MSHPYVTGLLVEQHLDNLRSEADRYRLAARRPTAVVAGPAAPGLRARASGPGTPAPVAPLQPDSPLEPVTVPAQGGRAVVPAQRVGSPEQVVREAESGVPQ